MVDVSRLAIAVDSSDLATGKTALKGFANEGKRTEAQIVKSADRMEKELAQTAIAAQNVSKGFNSHGLRMASMQLSQVAQQGAATGNYLQALAIQLPDLALGLGTVGIMAGVAAGALLPLVAGFMGVGDEAADFEASLKSLQAVADGLNEPFDLLKTSVRDLEKVYGEATDRVLQFALAQSQLRASQAAARLSEQVSIMDDLVASFITSSDAGYRFEETMRRIQDSFGVTGEAAFELEQAFQNLYVADSFQDQQIALQEILALLQEMGVDLKDIPPELQNAIDEMITLSNETDATQALMSQVRDRAAEIAPEISLAANEAARLNRNLAAASAAQSKSNLASQYAQYGAGRTAAESLIRENSSLYGGNGDIFAEDKAAAAARAARKRTSAGSSAASKAAREAQKAQNELNRDAERIIEGLRTEQEKYNDDLEQAKRLLDAGVLSQQQYSEHVAQLGQELRDQQPFVQEWKDSMIDAAMGGVDAFDSLRDAIIRAGLEYALFGTGKFAPEGGGGWGGLLTGLLPSFDGGGFTGTGSRTGGMDGKGGTLAMVHPNETVVDHTKGQTTGGGQMDVRVYVDDDGNWQAKVEQISGGVVQNAAPGIVGQSVNASQRSFKNSKSGWSP